ncbi:MAG TPA: hypothetical protein VKB79_28380 [Bryobacteraceae bacterium]|nr:hypothetical protein [Bryobacteraceae bacterium]
MALAFHPRESSGTGEQKPARIAVFPGAWNPPTVAHVAIAEAGLRWADEVIWILPRAFPHKAFDGVGFEERLEMLRGVAAGSHRFSVAVADGGLYVEIADEAREFFGPAVEIGLLCGRDAAERIAAWDYGEPDVFDRMIERYPLLVAGRGGEYLPHAGHVDRVIPLPMGASFDEVSSSEVRRRVEQGLEWRSLVPEAIADLVAAGYR